MKTNISVEERLALLEDAIAQLQEKVAIGESTNWLDQITGSFKDEPAFEEVLNYGKEIRQGNESILEDK